MRKRNKPKKIEIVLTRLDPSGLNGIYHFKDGSKIFFCEGKNADIAMLDASGNRVEESPSSLGDPYFTEAWNYSGGPSRPMSDQDVAEWERVMKRKMA